eukprot:Phypoly_transcript_13590.p1 GENE.Phypoly_transcript_13590~~Phypoly_transcript_13590.p1  ORF type:complete len:278 (+),score=66.72 Phypoly_transcript_13590:148-981(+)
MYTNQKGIQFLKQNDDKDNIYRRLEEEVFELRSENNVLRDKVKILQELLNSKDKTIPKGNPMETAKQQQKEQIKRKRQEQVREGVVMEEGEGEGEGTEEEESEEEEGVSALPIDYIPVQINNINYTNDTPTNNFQTNLTNTNPQSPNQTPNVDPAFQQYNKNSLYYLLVLFMMLIFIYKSKLVRAEKENKRMHEELARLRSELVTTMETFTDIFKNWGLEWRGSNLLIKQRVEEFRRMLKDPARWTKDKEEEDMKEDEHLASSTGGESIVDKQFSIE